MYVTLLKNVPFFDLDLFFIYLRIEIYFEDRFWNILWQYKTHKCKISYLKADLSDQNNVFSPEALHLKLLEKWADACANKCTSCCYHESAENLFECCFGWSWNIMKFEEQAALSALSGTCSRTTFHWEQGDKQSLPVDSGLKGFSALMSHLWKAVFHFKTLSEPSWAENNVYFLFKRVIVSLEMVGGLHGQNSQLLANWKVAATHRWFQGVARWLM